MSSLKERLPDRFFKKEYQGAKLRLRGIDCCDNCKKTTSSTDMCFVMIPLPGAARPRRACLNCGNRPCSLASGDSLQLGVSWLDKALDLFDDSEDILGDASTSSRGEKDNHI